MKLDRFNRLQHSIALLLAVFMICAPVRAFAQSFDLDCRQIPTKSGLTYGATRMHLQIDLTNKKWCADKCEKIDEVLGRNGESLTLLDGPGRFGDRLFRTVDMANGVLLDVFGAGATWERKTSYKCSSEPFEDFAPYLAADPEPRTNLGNRIYAAGFPKDGAGKPLEGIVGFRIEVGPDGSPIACKITQSSEVAALDDRVCPLLMPDTRFRPATDRKGRPVVGSYESKVRWISPN